MASFTFTNWTFSRVFYLVCENIQGKKITVEAKIADSKRKPKLLVADDDSHGACPLCRLNLNNLKYYVSDVFGCCAVNFRYCFYFPCPVPTIMYIFKPSY